ncbi:hypothetical protein [Sarcina ventriculi]|uniref:hypothetical protein n=1 Tax=Sarcina ventriculi TaxID=1267 RepID=UPI0018AC6003|nr:hypothetical protein [Sarcina ventriculi]
MKKVLYLIKKRLLLISMILTSFFYIGCSFNDKKDILPLRKEIDNYILDIEYTKMFEDSIITKYYITTKDGSNIDKPNIFLSIEDKDNNISYGTSPIEIYTNNISNDKLVVISECFIAKKRNNFMNVNYKLSGDGTANLSDNDKKININYNLVQDDKNYSHLHKEVCLNEINFNIESIVNLESGKLIQFNIYNLNYDNSKIIESILKDYNIKLKSRDYVNIYNINSIIGYNERYINDINSTNHYNENIKTIYFFQSYLDYDTSKIDLNNIQIYLTNNVTGEESLIYSN